MFGKKDFRVKLESHGRGGWIIYSCISELRFPWEVSGVNGIDISIPTAERWEAFCLKNDAEWAIPLRRTILERLAAKAVKRYWWGGASEIGEHWIHIRSSKWYL